MVFGLVDSPAQFGSSFFHSFICFCARYVVRVTSETASSDGSSSMAAVCGGAMALMDAGVPLAAPVAGIAMGLVVDRRSDNTNTDDRATYKILTDICALEDHFGDMDFKIAGTLDGITAAQMDCHAPVSALFTLTHNNNDDIDGVVGAVLLLFAAVREYASVLRYE